MRAVVGAGADDSARHAGDRLRQGHRARHPQLHDRGDRAMRAGRDPGDPVGSELCRRRGAGLADRGHARGARRVARGGAGQGAGVAHLPALPVDRRARRRDRRRGQERAGDRLGHRHRPRARRQRLGGADDARLRRARALRPRARRQDRNDDGPVRPGRSDPDLLKPAVAQFQLRRRSRQGRRGERHPRQDRPCRRRLHRSGAAGDGARAQHRHADLVGGRGSPRRTR